MWLYLKHNFVLARKLTSGVRAIVSDTCALLHVLTVLCARVNEQSSLSVEVLLPTGTRAILGPSYPLLVCSWCVH